MKKPSTDSIVIGIIVLFIGFVLLYPMGTLLRQSITLSNGSIGPDNFLTAWTDPKALTLFTTSISYSILKALLSVGIAMLLAFIIMRTNTPFRKVFDYFIVGTYLMPLLLGAISWIFLLSPRIGLINVWIIRLFNLSNAPFDVFTFWGLVWVSGLFTVPIAYRMIASGFRSMDPSLEEAARLSGASSPRVALKITLPIMRPVILSAYLFCFIIAMGAIEIPLLLGIPARIEVYTSRIFEALEVQLPPNNGLAAAYSMTLVAVTLTGLLFYRRFVSQGSKFTTVTGKGYRAGIIDLGRWRFFGAAICVGYLILTVVLPFCVLLLASFLRYWGAIVSLSWSSFTFDNYVTIFTYPIILRAITNTLLVSVFGSFLFVLIALVISHVVVRSRSRGKVLLDALVIAPIGFPAMVLAVGIMWAFISFPIPIIGTLWALLLGYLVAFLPGMVRYVVGVQVQLHPELEEAARVNGASMLTTLIRIDLPLLMPGIVSAWMYGFMSIVGFLSIPLLLSSFGTEVISLTMFNFYQNGQFTEAAALGILLMIIMYGVIFVVQKVTRVSFTPRIAGTPTELSRARAESTQKRSKPKS